MSSRIDLYSKVHKGLRRALCDLLMRAGNAGSTPLELQAIAERWRELQTLLEAHHGHEDLFLGPRLQDVAPVVFARLEREHAALHAELTLLGVRAARLGRCDQPYTWNEQAHEFYRQLAAFIARYFAHMADEENAAMAALQAAYSDVELATLEAALVASIEPGLLARFCSEMFAGGSADECFAMLADLRRNAPAAAFASLAQIAERVVPPARWRLVQNKLASNTAA